MWSFLESLRKAAESQAGSGDGRERFLYSFSMADLQKDDIYLRDKYPFLMTNWNVDWYARKPDSSCYWTGPLHTPGSWRIARGKLSFFRQEILSSYARPMQDLVLHHWKYVFGTWDLVSGRQRVPYFRSATGRAESLRTEAVARNSRRTHPLPRRSLLVRTGWRQLEADSWHGHTMSACCITYSFWFPWQRALCWSGIFCASL